MRSEIVLAAVAVAFLMFTHAGFVGGLTEEASLPATALSEAPDEFTLAYSYELLNSTRGPISCYTLEVSSNGSAAVELKDYFDPSGNTRSASASLGEEMIQYLRDALDQDGICALAGTYNDAAWFHSIQGYRTEELRIEADGGVLDLEFLGNAMAGAAPHTYVALYKLMGATLRDSYECLALDVQVDASMDQDGVVTVSSAFVNGASHSVTLGAVCEEVWPAIVVKSNGCTVTDLRSNILPTCVVTIEPGETYVFDEKEFDASGYAVGTYTVMTELGGFEKGFALLEVTEDLGHENLPPAKVWISADEKEGAEGTYIFDVSGACDAEDIPADLLVRWDWYNDGVWDTEWSHDRVAEHTFGNMSGYSVAVEVMDTDGAVSGDSVVMTMSSETSISMSSVATALTVGMVVVAVLIGLYLFKRGKGQQSH